MLSLLLALCIAFDVARELCFKMSARASVVTGLESSEWSLMMLPSLSTQWAAVGAIVWAIEIVAYSLVLARLPLNIAFPVMSLTYAATPLACWLLLDESISLQRRLGIGLVTAGVMIVGTAGVG